MSFNRIRRVRQGEAYYDNRSALFGVIEEWLATADLYRTCLNCKHWQAGPELCGKFNARPPAQIIVNSCPDYSDAEEIPF